MQSTKSITPLALLTRSLIGAGLVTSLISCGGGNTSAPDNKLAAIMLSSEAPVTTNWKQCGSEGGTCTFSGTQQVRYGNTNGYTYKTVTGPVACSNSVFGDPLPGVGKICSIPATPVATWTNCATESGTCSFSGTRQVRYGANGSYYYKTATTSIGCNNNVFGDPAVGVTKACAYSSQTATAPAPTPAPAPAPAPAPTPTPAPSAPGAAPTPSSVQPVPSNIASGSTVSLQCGVTYQGTLDLHGKSNIKVATAGSCGKANITPGRAVTGWTRYSGNIYSAAIGFTPVQVAVSGVPAAAAHWPNQPWATSTSGMPSTDLTGATQVYLDNQSVIKTQKLTSNSVSTAKPFYVEGKLWMLDAPGEWAVQNGRLYLWAPDGLSPEGRVWAAADANGINADNSSGVTIDGVRVFAATMGISANTASGLKVLNTEIINSATDGIWASGASGLVVDNSSVNNTRRNGIDGWYWLTGATITNTTVNNTGMVNMPSTTDAGIMIGDGNNNRIDNVKVNNSGYHGISVLHNRSSSLTNSTVDTACVNLHDCGGIYTAATDRQPLNLTISGNTVTNVKGNEGIAIYLDDSANGVTVTNNKVSNSTYGMLVHNGFNNTITYNTFSSDDVIHLAFAENGGTLVYGNKVNNNTFNSTKGEQTFNLGGGANVKTFATFDYNKNTSTNPGFFARTWDGSSAGQTWSYTGWKSWSGQDVHSTMN